MGISSVCAAALLVLAPPHPAPGERAVDVRSAAGVPLVWVEVATDWGWERVEVAPGEPLRLDLEGAVEVRAPGHLPGLLQPSDTQLFLEPDALLELDAVGPADGVRTVVLERGHFFNKREPGPGATQHASFGFAEPGRWVLVADGGSEATLRVRVEYADGERARIRLTPSPGLRARWQPQTADVRHAPLRVRFERPPEATGPLRVVLRRNSTYSAKPTASGAWGEAWDPVSEAHVLYEGELPAGASVLELGERRTGLDDSVQASERTTCAAGATSFTHDGTPVTLALEPGLCLVGTLVDASGAALAGPVLVEWRAHRGGRPSMDGVLRELELRAGAFELWLPRSHHFLVHLDRPRAVCRTGQAVDDAPRQIDLTIDAPGSRPGEFTFEVGESDELDVGTLVLEDQEAQLVLHPPRAAEGGGRASAVGLPPPRSVERLRFAGDRAAAWCVARAERSAGGLALFLQREPRTPDRYRLELDGRLPTYQRLPDPLPEAVLVVGPENAAFQADERGLRRRVGTATYDVTVVGALPRRASVTWRALPLDVERGTAPGGAVRFRFQGPRSGVFLAWPRGVRALRPGTQRIEL